jgi:hypothetical protein
MKSLLDEKLNRLLVSFQSGCLSSIVAVVVYSDLSRNVGYVEREETAQKGGNA